MPFKAVVVSTGGGAVVRRQNWGFMQHGVVVWLTGSPELLSRRALRDGTATRPLLSQNNGQGQGHGEPLLWPTPWLSCSDSRGGMCYCSGNLGSMLAY